MNIIDIVADLVIKTGDRVLIDTEYCKKHKEENNNCIDCESETGCKKVAEVLMLINKNAMYQPKTFNDFIEQQKYIDHEMKRILGAG